MFGYGLSLDVKDAPVAVVLEEPLTDATGLAAQFRLSPYFDARMITSMPQAEQLMLDAQIDAIVPLRDELRPAADLGDAVVQLLVHGTDANRARIIESYTQRRRGHLDGAASGRRKPSAGGPVDVRERLWFNEANESRYFLVPGLIVLIMTLIGAFLTALVMAREWERGTLEALFVTPVRGGKSCWAKRFLISCSGLIGLALCVV